jgi:hypothetical protein
MGVDLYLAASAEIAGDMLKRFQSLRTCKITLETHFDDVVVEMAWI